MKRIISRKIPETPPTPQQGASNPISGLTGLCVYVFCPNLFLSRGNIIPSLTPPPPPPKKKMTEQTAPLQAIFKGLYTNKNALTAVFSLACLEIRSRNEEAINSTRNMIYSLKVFYLLLYRRRYLLFVSELI